MPGFWVVLASGGTFVAVFGGFIAPVLFQRHLDRVELAKASGNPVSGLRRRRCPLVALSSLLIAAGSFAWLAATQGVSLLLPARTRVLDDMLYFGGLGCVGVGFAALLTIWTFRYPDFEPIAPRLLPFNGGMTETEAMALVGREGVVHAALRPQGNLKLGEQTYVVRTEGHFVEEGTLVRVDRIDGPNIVVRPVTEKG